jgi:hypothetical protein
MRSIDLWIRSYDNSRFKAPREPNPNWVSSKYDTSMPWKELQQTPIPELKDQNGQIMNWGKSVSALKKSWKAYKMAGQTGEPRRPIAWRIVSIIKALGLDPVPQFPELEGMDVEDDQEERVEGWSDLDEQLLREERLAEAEEDDWDFDKWKSGHQSNEEIF